MLKDKIQTNVMNHFRKNSKRSKTKRLCSPKISHLSSRGVEVLRRGTSTLISKKNKDNAANTQTKIMAGHLSGIEKLWMWQKANHELL